MIINGNVILTEVREDDSDTLYRWINDAATIRCNAPWRPVPWSAHSSWFDGIGRDTSKVLLVVRLRGNGPPVGVVQLIDIHPIHRHAELTIRIGEDVNRGKGLGTDALQGALDFARRDLNLQRVWLRVFANNLRAIRAYEKGGFEREGTMRRAAWIDGAWTDVHLMSVLFTN